MAYESVKLDERTHLSTAFIPYIIMITEMIFIFRVKNMTSGNSSVWTKVKLLLPQMKAGTTSHADR